MPIPNIMIPSWSALVENCADIANIQRITIKINKNGVEHCFALINGVTAGVLTHLVPAMTPIVTN